MKDTIKKITSQPTSWKKIYANYASDKGLVSRIKNSYNSKIKNNPMKKIGLLLLKQTDIFLHNTQNKFVFWIIFLLQVI